MTFGSCSPSRAEPRSCGASTGTRISASGRTTRNTARHDQWLASQPAMAGPTIDGSTQAVEIAPNTRGRSSSG